MTAPQLTADTFRDELIADGVLVETATPGLYLRSGAFEAVARGVAELVSAAGAGTAEPCLHLPPVLARADLERTGYPRSFPHLTGLVATFGLDDADHRLLLTGGESPPAGPVLEDSGLALCSAACHPLYPTLAGPVPAAGRRFEVEGFCFRHEPSLDPARMQCFRQHEFVYVGSRTGALAFRDEWIERGRDLLAALGLSVAVQPANDPFFGRAGCLLAASQREARLKLEIVAPIVADSAIASANYHEDHFGSAFGLLRDDGRPAHTACIGFGLERIALALIRRHGPPRRWTSSLRSALGL